MIVRCDAVENYMFLKRFTTGVSGWIVTWGSSHELYAFTVEQPDTIQHNGMINSVEISCFVTSNWKLLSLKMRRAPH